MGKARLSEHSKWMLFILLVSFILRLYLVLQGGPHYWPDESRFEVSRSAANFLFSGDLKSAYAALDSADHFLFKVVGVVPAALEKAISTDLEIPALFFALFSVFNVWLIWRISLRLGSGESEALLSAFLLALASSFFYYSRHLLPYDASMTFGLLSLLVAVRTPTRKRDSCFCALLSSACFLTYNGYWTLAAFTMVVHVTWARPGTSEMISRAWRSAVCFWAPPLAVVTASSLFGGDLLDQFIWFSNSVTQGEFSEGATLPIAYLWHTEHFLLLVWVLAFGFSMWAMIKGASTARSTMGVAGILFIYGFMVLTSVGLNKFVVYGRLVRQLVPFFCLLTAYQLQHLRGVHGGIRRAFPILCTMLVLQAAFNFRVPLQQVFPSDFVRKANKTAEALEGGRTANLLFAHHLYPVPEDPRLPPHTILLQERHPIQFLPNQYEGYTPEERSALRSMDISMRLFVLDQE